MNKLTAKQLIAAHIETKRALSRIRIRLEKIGEGEYWENPDVYRQIVYFKNKLSSSLVSVEDLVLEARESVKKGK